MNKVISCLQNLELKEMLSKNLTQYNPFCCQSLSRKLPLQIPPPPQLLQTLEEGNHYLSYSLSVHAIQPFSLSKRRPITAQTQELKLLGINWVCVSHMHFMAKSFNTVHFACWISDALIQGFKSPIKCNLKSAFSAVKGKPGAHIFNHDTVYLFLTT